MSQRVEILIMIIPSRVDKQMGMGIIRSNRQIFISSILPGSLAAEYFRVRDRILAINGVHVNEKKQCRELILSASTESEFAVEIERRAATEVKLPATPQSEIDDMPNLSFIPGVEKKSASVRSKKTASKTKPKPKKLPKVVSSLYDDYVDDSEFPLPGNPMDGMNFPQPQDVRDIVKNRLSQILTDFTKYESKKHAQRQAPQTGTTNVEYKNISTTKIASDVPANKELMKLKH